MKADINAASSGDNIIIAAPSFGYLAIDFITLIPSSAVTVQMKNGSTSYGGPLPLDQKQPFTFENTLHNESGVITCLPGEAFVINLNAAVQVGGFIRYRIVGS